MDVPIVLNRVSIGAVSIPKSFSVFLIAPMAPPAPSSPKSAFLAVSMGFWIKSRIPLNTSSVPVIPANSRPVLIAPTMPLLPSSPISVFLAVPIGFSIALRTPPKTVARSIFVTSSKPRPWTMPVTTPVSPKRKSLALCNGFSIAL